MTMNRDIAPLFSTPVYMSRNKELALEFQDKMNDLEFYRIKANCYFSEDNYILEREDFKPLKDYILKSVQTFVHEDFHVSRDIEFYITNSWITVHDHGDWAAKHSHNNSLFSGTYYIDIPEDDESHLVFHAPDEHRIWPHMFAAQTAISDFNIFNSDAWSIPPETGTTLIFPSTLEHSVTPLTSHSKRYCLAYNVLARGSLSTLGPGVKKPIDRIDIQ